MKRLTDELIFNQLAWCLATQFRPAKHARRFALTLLVLSSVVCASQSPGLHPGSWTQKAAMPRSTSTPASCVANRMLYVIGGHYPDATTALRTVQAYDPRTDSWTLKADLPTARHYLAAAAVDGIIYVVGGSGAGAPGAPVRPVAIYNPRTDTWTNGASIPTARGAHAACAVDGIVYAIGGSDGSQELASVEAYDPKSNQWTRRSSMPQRLWFPTASVVNGIIYVFHGTNVFLYDPKTDHWTTQAGHFSPYSWGLMSAEVDGVIYLFGGFTQDWTGGFDSTFAYDPAHDQFTTRRKLLRPRATGSCGVIDRRIYLAAGVSKEPVVNPDAVFYRSLEVFDPQGGVTPQLLSLTCETTKLVRLVWQGEAATQYGIESTPNIASGPWTRMMFTTGTNAVMASNALVEASCLVNPSDTNRFFRVLEAN